MNMYRHMVSVLREEPAVFCEISRRERGEGSVSSIHVALRSLAEPETVRGAKKHHQRREEFEPLGSFAVMRNLQVH